jgi:hypothetical protein
VTPEIEITIKDRREQYFNKILTDKYPQSYDNLSLFQIKTTVS